MLPVEITRKAPMENRITILRLRERFLRAFFQLSCERSRPLPAEPRWKPSRHRKKSIPDTSNRPPAVKKSGTFTISPETS